MKKKVTLLSLLFVCAIGSAGGMLTDAYISPEAVFAKELACENEKCVDEEYRYVCKYQKSRNCKLNSETSCTASICSQ